MLLGIGLLAFACMLAGEWMLRFEIKKMDAQLDQLVTQRAVHWRQPWKGSSCASSAGPRRNGLCAMSKQVSPSRPLWCGGGWTAGWCSM